MLLFKELTTLGLRHIWKNSFKKKALYTVWWAKVCAQNPAHAKKLKKHLISTTHIQRSFTTSTTVQNLTTHYLTLLTRVMCLYYGFLRIRKEYSLIFLSTPSTLATTFYHSTKKNPGTSVTTWMSSSYQWYRMTIVFHTSRINSTAWAYATSHYFSSTKAWPRGGPHKAATRDSSARSAVQLWGLVVLWP